MQIILNIDHQSEVTLKSQLLGQFRDSIRSGMLKPSSCLPSTRELSLQLGVSRNTVSEVYECLIEEGYLVTRHKVGTFVTDKLPDHTVNIPPPQENKVTGFEEESVTLPPPFSVRGHSGLYRSSDPNLMYDFALGRTDGHSFPQKIWRRLLIEKLGASAVNMSQYLAPAGHANLRQLIANFLGPTKGIVAKQDQVIIVAGCQQGLSLVSHMFIDCHTPIVVEAPCYRGAAYLIERYGGQIIQVPVDENGIIIEKLPSHPVRMIYVTPSHQFPTGGTMSLERRLALLDWAAKANAYIVEVDYDVNYRYEDTPLPSLAALDKNNCVIYMSSFSRSLGPGLRLGYVVVPEPLVEPATTIRSLLDNGSPWLEQATLAQFILDGCFDKHLLKLRHNNLKRRDALVNVLKKHFKDVVISGTEAGMHILWHLDKSIITASEVQAIGKSCGVGVYPLHDSPACYYEGLVEYENVLLLGYNHLDESRIEKGIETLANAMKERLQHN